jgi:hypothetical protein
MMIYEKSDFLQKQKIFFSYLLDVCCDIEFEESKIQISMIGLLSLLNIPDVPFLNG